jgi:hypothetical protein
MDELMEIARAVEATRAAKEQPGARFRRRRAPATPAFLFSAAAAQGTAGAVWWYILPSIAEPEVWVYVFGFVPFVLLAITSYWRPISASLVALGVAGLFLGSQCLNGGMVDVDRGFAMFKAPVLCLLVLALTTSVWGRLRGDRALAKGG